MIGARHGGLLEEIRSTAKENASLAIHAKLIQAKKDIRYLSVYLRPKLPRNPVIGLITSFHTNNEEKYRDFESNGIRFP
jgi:hypothetical protein